MHVNCVLCSTLNRARAYDLFGNKHWIPALHSANWLRGDLRIAVSGLGPGEEVELDYRGQAPDAPRIAVRRSVDDVFTAQGPDGWRDAPGNAQWIWPPSEQPDRLEQLAFTLLSFLKERRGAAGVILIEPN